MATFEIAFLVDREATDKELDGISGEELDSSGIVAFETGSAGIIAHLAIDAPNLGTALARGVRQVEGLGSLDLRVVGVASDDLVSIRDVAARTGRTYESVRLLAAGKRGPGGFPRALSTGQWALYSWTAVAAWFAEHYGGDAPSDYDRLIAAANLLVKARHAVTDKAERAELAELFAA